MLTPSATSEFRFQQSNQFETDLRLQMNQMPTSDLIFTLKHLCKSRAQIQQVHAHAITTALFSLDPSPLLSHILHSFASSSSSSPSSYHLIYSTNVFNLIPNPSTFHYNNIIRAHTILHSPHSAFTFFLQMRRRPLAPDSHTFSFVLKACGLLQNSHSLAMALHAQLTKFGFSDHEYVCSALCCTYGRSGDVHGAEAVFEGNSVRDAVTYNTMIGIFFKAGEFDRARDLFDEMPRSFRDVFTYNAMIDGLFKAGHFVRARDLFDEMPRSFKDVVSYTTMIDGLFKAGDFNHARVMFDEMPYSFRNEVSYTAMIDGLFKVGDFDRARGLFDEMPHSFRDKVTYNTMIDGLFKAGDFDRARGLFDEMPHSFKDVVSYTTMIDGLFKAGDFDRARDLFDEMPHSFKDVVSYTTMIDGLFKAGDFDRARRLFDEMPHSIRNVVTYNTMIDGLFKAGDFDRARRLFDEMPHSVRNVVTYNTMIDGLFKAGDFDRARRLFDEMPHSFKDVVSYTTMIDGLFKAGDFDRARGLFDEMPHSFKNEVCYAAMIDGLFKAGDFDHARELFDKMPISFRNGVTYSAMIDGLCKAGDINCAKELFDEIPSSFRNVVSYGAMLMGLAMHGHSGSVLEQYVSRMLEDGVKPNGVTILAILVGCSHSGLINDAKRIFMEMESVYGVQREIQHYGCMVDLLARAGMIKEAKEVIEGMPMEGDASAWGALLAGCKTYGDVEVAEEAAKHLMLAKPDDGAVFSNLAHVYASLGQWDEVEKVRRLRGRPGVTKRKGCSTILLDGTTH